MTSTSSTAYHEFKALSDSLGIDPEVSKVNAGSDRLSDNLSQFTDASGHFVCPLCDKPFSSASALNFHSRRVHDMDHETMTQSMSQSRSFPSFSPTRDEEEEKVEESESEQAMSKDKGKPDYEDISEDENEALELEETSAEDAPVNDESQLNEEPPLYEDISSESSSKESIKMDDEVMEKTKENSKIVMADEQVRKESNETNHETDTVMTEPSEEAVVNQVAKKPEGNEEIHDISLELARIHGEDLEPIESSSSLDPGRGTDDEAPVEDVEDGQILSEQEDEEEVEKNEGQCNLQSKEPEQESVDKNRNMTKIQQNLLMLSGSGSFEPEIKNASQEIRPNETRDSSIPEAAATEGNPEVLRESPAPKEPSPQPGPSSVNMFASYPSPAAEPLTFDPSMGTGGFMESETSGFVMPSNFDLPSDYLSKARQNPYNVYEEDVKSPPFKRPNEAYDNPDSVQNNQIDSTEDHPPPSKSISPTPTPQSEPKKDSVKEILSSAHKSNPDVKREKPKKEKCPEGGKDKYLELFGEENEERTPKPKKKRSESPSKERVPEKLREKDLDKDKVREKVKETEKPLTSVKTELELKRQRMLKHLKAYDEEKVDATLEKSDLRRKKVGL